MYLVFGDDRSSEFQKCPKVSLSPRNPQGLEHWLLPCQRVAKIMFIEVDHIQQPLACCVARWGTRLGQIKMVDIDEYRFTSTASLSRELRRSHIWSQGICCRSPKIDAIRFLFRGTSSEQWWLVLPCPTYSVRRKRPYCPALCAPNHNMCAVRAYLCCVLIMSRS